MDIDNYRSVVVKSENGSDTFPLTLPINTLTDSLCLMLNELKGKSQVAERVWYKFYTGEKEIRGSLSAYLSPEQLKNHEQVIHITYVEEAPFMVHPVTRCTSSMPGHAESVISATFSPDSRVLATGSGDTTVRLWDTDSQTPLREAKGHSHWVLCLAWAPDGRRLASGDHSGNLIVWDAATAVQMGKTLTGHKKWITSLAWEPYHMNSECRHVASSSKDCDVRIWDTRTFTCVRTLAGHTGTVSCVRWGGAGLVYTASHDRTIRVWRVADGVLVRVLEGHAHWVNTLALSTEWVIKCGPFTPNPDKSKGAQSVASRYQEVRGDSERLVSGSDDFTMFLWCPESSKLPVRRLTGHQQLVNDVKFSPDARVFASASFDKSIRLWKGLTGDYLGVLRGHVQPVYVLAWSSDSRRIVSGSADSTLKVWDVGGKCLEVELPGHADEVFAVDWCLDGSKVGSGGKDKLVRLWQA